MKSNEIEKLLSREETIKQKFIGFPEELQSSSKSDMTAKIEGRLERIKKAHGKLEVAHGKLKEAHDKELENARDLVKEFEKMRGKLESLTKDPSALSEILQNFSQCEDYVKEIASSSNPMENYITGIMGDFKDLNEALDSCKTIDTADL